MAFDEACFSEKEMHDIELFKNNLGLGITVAGYVCDEEELSGLFVKDISTGSLADLTRKIQRNDRIIKVNDKPITSLSNQEAIELLRSSGEVVKLTVERYLLGSTFEVEKHSFCSHKFQTPLASSERLEEEESRNLNIDNNELNNLSANLLLDKNLDSPPFPLCKNCKKKECDKTENLFLKPKSNLQSNNLKNKIDLSLEKKQPIGMVDAKNEILQKGDISANSDSIYYSKSDDTEKDGYETCMDESLSDEYLAKTPTCEAPPQSDLTQTLNVSSDDLEITTGECSTSKNDNFKSANECLEFNETLNNNLEVYSNPSDLTDTDEFFLVEYVNDNVPENDLNNYLSESDVPYAYEVQTSITYKCIKLHEYYNDFEDCLVYLDSPSKKASINLSTCDENYSYNQSLITLTTDEEIYVPHSFLFKSNSDSQLYQHFGEFDCVEDKRRASFIPPYNELEHNDIIMTVTSQQQTVLMKNQQNSDKSLTKQWSSVKNIDVFRKSTENLGISIVCGKVNFHTPYNESLESASGIFIKSIVPNSAAGNAGLFHVGDRILEVNGFVLTDVGHEEAASIIRAADNPISFVVQSLVPPFQDNLNDYSSYEDKNSTDTLSNLITDNTLINGELTVESKNETDERENETPTKTASEAQPTVTVSSPEHDTTNITPEVPTSAEVKRDPTSDDEDEEDDDFEDERELEGKIYTKKGEEIDRSSAGNFRRTTAEIAADPEEEDEFGYTADKIKKKYAKLGNTIMMIKLERGQQGLGLSLAGHKDRNCMAVFVCGLNPNGAAYKTGGIEVGDEILEVNGVVLHGRCHLNASAIIKGLAGPVFKILVLRRKTAIDDIAVRPLTHFPVYLEDEVFEDRFTNYPNVHTVVIKKESHSLGIMIIEGKHTELGQGIFISDIQEESPADKAGLEVGEMILAVNKESLLGSSYDNAATLLKRTEGVVTLILSNPKKTTETIETETSTGLKTSGPPSRAVTPVPEPPADPSTCSIISGRNTSIEIMTNNQGLGLFFVGGKDTLIGGGIIIVEVFSGGAAEKDGRLQPGDQIIEANGVSFKDINNDIAIQTLRQTLPKIKLVIFRPDKIEYTTVDVDLIKKPGKGLGLSVIGTKCGKGVYISDVLNGGNADIDGKVTRGDFLISVNEEKTENLNVEQIGVLLKTITGKAVLKFHRYKSTSR